MAPSARPSSSAWLRSPAVVPLRARDNATVAMRGPRRAAASRREIVAADEREAGERALLNFGHTFGHAIEVGDRLRRLAARRSGSCGHGAGGKAFGSGGRNASGGQRPALPASLPVRLPVRAPALGADRYLELMARDKKVEAGTLRLVLLDALGRATIRCDIAPSSWALFVVQGQNRGPMTLPWIRASLRAAFVRDTG